MDFHLTLAEQHYETAKQNFAHVIEGIVVFSEVLEQFALGMQSSIPGAYRAA